MSTSEIKNLQEFNDVTNKDKVAVIDFWAAWCLPCKAISPVFEVFATRFPELAFYKVNVSEARDVSQAAGIRGLPTFQSWQRGTKIGEVAGADRSKLEGLVNEAANRR